MKKTNLHVFLEEKDYAGFQKFLKGVDIGSVTEEEECEFFRIAPKEWLKDYVTAIFPQPKSEKILMVRAPTEILKISEEQWGFFEENVLWAFQSSSKEVCMKVLNCLPRRPKEEIELAMVRRKSSNLLKLWLKKFGYLGDSAEKLINEFSEYMPLKCVYINEQLAKT